MIEFIAIREALEELDRLESNATCNDFDKAHDALAMLKIVEARAAEQSEEISARADIENNLNRRIAELEREMESAITTLETGSPLAALANLKSALLR